MYLLIFAPAMHLRLRENAGVIYLKNMMPQPKEERCDISEYHCVETQYNNKECIIKSLEELGYKPIIADTAKALMGYEGKERKQKAHIIIPKFQIGTASNDVGFELVNGKYVLRISEYDLNINSFNQKKMKQLYAKHVTMKFLQLKCGKFKLASQTTTKNSIKIKLKRR